MEMKTIYEESDSMRVIADPECARIVRDLIRIISCEVHDEDNRRLGIKLIKELCTDKWD